MDEAHERHGLLLWHWLGLALVAYVLSFAMLLYDITHSGVLRVMGPSFWSAMETIYAPLIYLVEHL